MTMKTAPYWDKQTLIIYGLLGGYTRLSPQEVNEAVVNFVNQEGNVLPSIELLAELEEQRKIKVQHIWLNLRKYRSQLEELPESDERDELTSKVQHIIDWEADSSRVLRANILDLMEWKPVITELFAGCLDFTVKVTAKKWIRGVIQEYLERYRKNDLFTPTEGSYIHYRQQHLALTDYLGRSKPQQTLNDLFLPNKIRLLELLYDLVDNSKLVIEGFDSGFNPMVNSDIGKSANAQRVDVSQIRLEPRSYDAANGILTVLGEPINFIRQKNMKGKDKEKNPAKLLRALFHPLTFPDPVPIKNVFPIDLRLHKDRYPRDVVNKATSLVTDINELVQEKYEGIKLIKCDGMRFILDDRYLKK